ncbi:MAG: MFS transporter [Chloroflexi bacterium]|nr:MFS transporter [Chloroflexota bacterium]
MQSFAAINVLKNPVFRRLWFVTMAGGLSVGATITTLGWVVVEESGSPFLVSLVLVSFMGPQLVAGPIGGVLADRFGRPRLIRLGTASRAVLAIVMAVSLFTLPHELFPLFVINTLRSVTTGATIPSRRAFMADIVPSRQLTSALALDEFALTLMFIVGPVVTGSLLVFVEPGYIFLVLAVISTIAVAVVPDAPEGINARVPGVAPPVRGSFVRELFAGFGYIKRSRILLAVTAISLAAEMLAFNYMILIPVFAKEVFNGGSELLGVLNGTMPAGELIGAATMAVLAARVIWPGRVLTISIAMTFAIGIPLGASSWLPLTLVLLALIGGLGQAFFVMSSTMLLRETPSEARARVLGLQQVTWGAGALGGIVSGVIASTFNPHLGIIIPSALGLGIVLVIVVLSPELRQGGRAISSDDDTPEIADSTMVTEQSSN